MAHFKFGNFEFPDKFIKWGASDSKPNQRQDLDSYTDGYGVTQRNVLGHTKTEVQFTTLPMSGNDMRMIMDGIVSNYIDYKARDAQCTYYDDENGRFKTGHLYLDPSLKFNREETGRDGIPKRYGEMQWTFIEY